MTRLANITRWYTSMSRRRFLAYIFVFSLLVRILFLFWNPSGHKIELFEHGDIAHNIYTGHGFTMHWPYPPLDSIRQVALKNPPTHEGAFLPPINPYLLTAFYFGFGENGTALLLYNLLMCIISALVPVMMYMLAKLFASENVSRLAAVLAGVNVFAAFGAATYTGSSLYQLAAAASIYSLLVAFKKKKITYYCIIGVLTAVLTLLRSEYFLLGPLLIVLSAFLFKERRSVRMQYMIIALAAHSIVVAPWVYRNYRLFDRFVPVLSHPWYEIWRGNNPWANGTTRDATGTPIWVEAKHSPQIVRAMDSLPYDERFEVAADSIFKTEVMQFWRHDPLHALGLGGRKILMFMTSDFHSIFYVDIVYAVTSFLIFGAAIVGMLSGLRRKASDQLRAASILFALFLAYYLGLTFFTVMLPRYQIYVLNTILPMAALGFSLLSDSRKFSSTFLRSSERLS